jgi:hypothetical protein
LICGKVFFAAKPLLATDFIEKARLNKNPEVLIRLFGFGLWLNQQSERLF